MSFLLGLVVGYGLGMTVTLLLWMVSSAVCEVRARKRAGRQS